MRFSSAALITFLVTASVAGTALTAESGLPSQRRALIQERVRALGHSVKRRVVRLESEGAARALQDDACETGRDDLAANGNLTAARSDLDDAFSNAIDQDCVVPDNLELGDPFTCIKDENEFVSATQDHREACIAAGGAVYELDFTIKCVISSGDDESTITVGFENGDFCEAPMCETSDIVEDAEELTSLLNEAEDELESIGDQDDDINVKCDTSTVIRDPEGEEIYQEELEVSATTIGAHSVVAVTAAMLALIFVGVVA